MFSLFAVPWLDGPPTAETTESPKLGFPSFQTLDNMRKGIQNQTQSKLPIKNIYEREPWSQKRFGGMEALGLLSGVMLGSLSVKLYFLLFNGARLEQWRLAMMTQRMVSLQELL